MTPTQRDMLLEAALATARVVTTSVTQAARALHLQAARIEVLEMELREAREVTRP